MNLTTINEIRVTALALEEHLEAIIGMVTDKIRDEVDSGNMAYIAHCAETVLSLEKDLRALASIRDHSIDVLTDTLSFQPDAMMVSKSQLRTLQIEVSQGMINQHLLTLSEAKSRGLVKIGEIFTIQLPDGTTFSTELCDPGNKLRDRGHIRRFYENANIVDGGIVFLSEISRGSWKLVPENSVEGMELKNAFTENVVGKYYPPLGDVPVTTKQSP